MNLPEQLTKSHNRNWMHTVLRLFLIILNPTLIFLRIQANEDFTGRLQNESYQPITESLRLTLVTFLLVHQTTIAIPEINVQHEEIRLISKDQKLSIFLLIYNIFLFLWNCFGCDIFGYRYSESNKEFESTFLILYGKKRKHEGFLGIFLEKFFWGDIFFIIASVLCVVSSRKYKFVIKQSAKQAIEKILKIAIPFLKISLGISLLSLSFYTNDDILNLVFLALLIYICVMLIQEASTKETNKFQVLHYVHHIKWSVIVVIIVNQALKGIHIPHTEHWGDILRSIRDTAVMELQIILFISMALVYLKYIYTGAKMDFFDAQLANDSDKLYLYNSIWKKGDDIKDQESFTLTYFSEKLIHIMGHDKEDIFNKNAAFNITYIRKLYNSSKIIKGILDRYKNEYILNQPKKQILKLIIIEFVCWMRNTLISNLKKNFSSLVLIVTHLYSAYFFLFVSHNFMAKQNSEDSLNIHSPLNYMLLYWCLCTMVMKNPVFVKYLTFVLIYPAFMVNFLMMFTNYIWFMSGCDQTIRGKECLPFKNYIEEVQKPIKMYQYGILFVLITLYNLVILYQTKEARFKAGVAELFEDSEEKIEEEQEMAKEKEEDTLPKIFMHGVSIFIAKLRNHYRYIPMSIAILASLMSINILNVILMFFVLLLIWNPDKDKQYSLYFLGYNFFMVIIKHIGNHWFPIQQFNVEYVSMLGIVTIDDELRSTIVLTYRSYEMIVLFILCIFSSIRYNTILSSDDEKKIDFSKLFKKSKVEDRVYFGFRFIDTLTTLNLLLEHFMKTYMIWVYHIFFNLILVNDQKDFASTSLFIIESCCLLLHLIIWKRKNNKSYWWIYWTWFLSFMFVFVYVLLRYSLFFLRYSTIYHMIRENSTILLVMNFIFPKSLIANYDFGEIDSNILMALGSYRNCLLILIIGIMTRNSFIVRFKEQKVESQAKQSLGNALFFGASKKKETEKKERMKSRRNLIVGILLLYKGAFVPTIIWIFTSKLTLFKCILLSTFLFTILNLIVNIVKVFHDMQVIDFIHIMIRYFYQRFVKGTDKKKGFVIHELGSTIINREFIQIKSYYQQLLIKLENVLLHKWRLYWYIIFVPLVFYNAILWMISYLYQQMNSHTNVFETALKYWIDLKPNQSEEINRNIIQNELSSIQLAIVALLIEFVYVEVFVESTKEIEQLPETLILALKGFLINKYTYYISLGLKKHSKEETAKLQAEYEESQTVFYRLTLEAKTNTKIKIPDNLISENDLLSAGITKNVNLIPHRRSSIKSRASLKFLETTFLKNESIFKPLNETEEASSGEEEDIDDIDIMKTTKEDKESRNGHWLNRLFGVNNSSNKNISVHYMNEDISRESMLLFVYLNRYKFYFARFLTAFVYSIRRISLFPAIFFVCYKVNVLNIAILIMFCVISFRKNSIFTEGLRTVSWIFTIYMILTAIHLFIDDSYEDQAQRFYIGLNSFQPYFRPTSKHIFILAGCWYSIICFGFVLILTLMWYTAIQLFVIRIRKDSDLYFYLLDKNRVRYVVINYERWKKGSLKFINFLNKQFFLHSMEIHNFLTVTLSLLFLDYQSVTFLLVILVTFFVSFYDHFKKISTRNMGNFSLSKETDSNYLHLTFKVYAAIYWSMFLIRHIIEFSQWREKNDESNKLYTNFDPKIQGLILMTISTLFRDLSDIEKFSSTRENIRNESDLKRQYSSMCYAYDFCEEKIYKRLTLMMSKATLDRMSTDLLEMKEKDNIVLEFDYMKRCLRGKFADKRDEFFNLCFGFFGALKQKLIYCTYTFLERNSNPILDFDLLYLYSNMKQRNRSIMMESTLDLSDYFHQNFEFFHLELKKIKLEYDLLRERDNSKIDTYQSNLKERLDQLEELPKILINREMKKDSIVNLNYQQMRLQAQQELHSNQHGNFLRCEAISKDTDLLYAASDILFDNLKKELRNTSGSLESFKNEFKRNGFINCKYGELNVVVYNITRNEISQTMGYNIFHFITVLNLLIKTFATNFETFVIILIMVTQVLNGGMFNFFILGIILFLVLVEENLGMSTWWKIIYIALLMVKIIKLFTLVSKFTDFAYVEYFVGSIGNYDLLSILSVMFLIENLKKLGFSDYSLSSFENPGMAIARLILNDDIENIIERIYEKELRLQQLCHEFVTAKLNTKGKLNNKVASTLKVRIVNNVLFAYQLIDNFRMESRTSLLKLIKLMRNEVYTITQERLDQFFYRNFTYQLRKIGKDYYFLRNLSLIAIIVYIFILFSHIDSKKNESFTKVIVREGQTVPALIIANFIAYTLFILIEYIFYKAHPDDMLGMRENSTTLRILKGINFNDKVFKEPSSYLDRFRNVARKIKVITMLAKFSKKARDATYKKNPQLYYFFYLICVWIYVNVSVYFFHSYIRNPLSNKEDSYLDKVVCTEEEMLKIFSDKNACIPYLKDNITQGFYALNIIYITLGVLNIKSGKPYKISGIIDMGNLFQKINFKIFTLAPFVREACTMLEYCTIRTCLSMSDFLLLTDLKAFMCDAMALYIAKKKNPVGKEIGRIQQVWIAIGIVVAILILIVFPLGLFSKIIFLPSIFPETVFSIKEGSLSLTLLDADNQFVGSLFEVNKMIANERVEKSDTFSKSSENKIIQTEVEKDFFKNIYKHNELNKYERNRFIRVNFSRYSDKHTDLTPKIIDNLKKYIESQSRPPKIMLNITFLVPESKKSPYFTFTKPIELQKKYINQMKTILSTGCQTPDRARESEMFLTVLPSVLLFDRKKIEPISTKTQSDDLQIKIALSMKCSDSYLSYSWMPISTPNIELIIISQTMSPLIAYVHDKFNFSFLTTQNLYMLIIVLVGLNSIRGIFGGQTVSLWYQQIPRTEVILLIMDAISNSRCEGDFIKEEMLYLLLVDIMRNPELLRKITDCTFETRIDLFKSQLKGNYIN